MIIIKIMFLFLAIMFTFVNITRMMFKNEVPAVNIIIQSIGITGFLVLQFWDYLK